MKRKLISAMLITAVTVVMAAGCGGNGGNSENSGSGSNGSSSSEGASGESGGGTFVVPINTNSVASLTPYNVYGADDLRIVFACSGGSLMVRILRGGLDLLQGLLQVGMKVKF